MLLASFRLFSVQYSTNSDISCYPDFPHLCSIDLFHRRTFDPKQIAVGSGYAARVESLSDFVRGCAIAVLHRAVKQPPAVIDCAAVPRSRLLM